MAYLATIYDLEVLAQPGGAVLQSASGALGGLTSFTLTQSGIAQFSAQASYATTTLSYSPVPHAGSTLLISLVRLQKVLATADTGANGAATDTTVYHHNYGFVGDMAKMLAVTLASGTYVYTGVSGDGALITYQLSGTSTLTQVGVTADTAATYLGDVAAMASVRIGAQALLFAASAGENGITSFTIAADGSLQVADVLGAQQDLFASGTCALETVQLAGDTFLLAASAGSSTLSVIRILPTGQMRVVDHVYDSQDTRFANASALEVVTAGDRVFVLVAGSDDGLSLFTLLPDGRLLHLGSFEDTATTTLQNITALAAAVIGAEIQVFAAAAGEDGITQFRIDLSQLGQTLIGTVAGDTLTGTSLDDVIAGENGADTLAGGSGNDIVMDGGGADLLSGGMGADTFVLTYDGQPDTITDFQIGTDRLDLSAWPMLYSAGQLTLVQTPTGAILTFGAEQLYLVSASLSPLALAQFTAADLLNLMRQSGILTGPTLNLAGTSGADIMIGSAAGDIFRGTMGGDYISGGAGMDMVDYTMGTSAIKLDLLHPDRNSGLAAADTYDSIEKFCGTAGADHFAGDRQANRFSAGAANDRIMGRGGADQLDGELGDDHLTGGRGSDQLTGGLGADRFIFRRSSDSATQTGQPDIIIDFQQGTDYMVFKAIDADPASAGNQSFAFIGSAAFSGQPGQLRAIADSANRRTWVEADLNGDRVADSRVQLAGLFSLTAGDFSL